MFVVAALIEFAVVLMINGSSKRKNKKVSDEVFSTVKNDNIEVGYSKRSTDHSTVHQRYRVNSGKLDNSAITNQRLHPFLQPQHQGGGRQPLS